MSYRGSAAIEVAQDLTDTELAYIAGVLDGEGYVRSDGAGLCVTMTELPVVAWLRNRIGGRLNEGLTSQRTPRFTWQLSRKADLAYLLPRLMPHLKLKGGEAYALLRITHHRLARPVAATADCRERHRYESVIMQTAIHSVRGHKKGRPFDALTPRGGNGQRR